MDFNTLNFLLVGSTAEDFLTVHEGEILCLCTVTFGQKVPNWRLLNTSRPIEIVPRGGPSKIHQLTTPQKGIHL